LLRIARGIEADLALDLGILLDLKSSDVEAIKTSNQHNSRNWVFHILNKWRQGQRRDADKIRILTDALEEIGKVDLANKVRAEKQQSLESRHPTTSIPSSIESFTQERCDFMKIGYTCTMLGQDITFTIPKNDI
ncbi:unnamed protein product, partial [Owenia fusiformis]